MADRLKVTIEFNKGSIEDLKFYANLKKFDKPGIIIKNVIMGKLPASVLEVEEDEKN